MCVIKAIRRLTLVLIGVCISFGGNSFAQSSSDEPELSEEERRARMRNLSNEELFDIIIDGNFSTLKKALSPVPFKTTESKRHQLVIDYYDDTGRHRPIIAGASAGTIVFYYVALESVANLNRDQLLFLLTLNTEFAFVKFGTMPNGTLVAAAEVVPEQLNDELASSILSNFGSILPRAEGIIDYSI